VIVARLALATAALVALRARPAAADHGGPLVAAPMSPLVVALIAAALALVGIVLLAAIVTLLRKPAGRDE
jgi:hypothetical protein